MTHPWLLRDSCMTNDHMTHQDKPHNKPPGCVDAVPWCWPGWRGLNRTERCAEAQRLGCVASITPHPPHPRRRERGDAQRGGGGPAGHPAPGRGQGGLHLPAGPPTPIPPLSLRLLRLSGPPVFGCVLCAATRNTRAPSPCANLLCLQPICPPVWRCASCPHWVWGVTFTLLSSFKMRIVHLVILGEFGSGVNTPFFFWCSTDFNGHRR